jgi:hypothetical protein
VGTELQAATPVELPIVDLGQLELLRSVPQWIGSLQKAAVTGPDGNPVWEPKPKIPASLMPTGPQRQAIETICGQLELAERAGPIEASASWVGKLIEFYANGQTSEETADTKLAGFMIAVGDLPAWAIENAVTSWFRGKCGKRNYEFAPSPALFREIAESQLKIARGHRASFERLLRAEPIDEPTEAEREAVAGKWDEFKREMEAVATANSMREATEREARERRRKERIVREAEAAVAEEARLSAWGVTLSTDAAKVSEKQLEA